MEPAPDRPTPPPDWRLPPGVNRGLWDYLHDSDLARNYDHGLAGSSLFQADEAFVVAHCAAGGRLVDLGCGTGRLLLTFASRGHRVVGVDLSAAMLTVAAAKARTARVRVDLVRANLVELTALVDGAFDCAACLFSTLGMIRGAAARQQVVQHAYRLLRPGGRFVVHVHNRWFSLWDPGGRRWLLANLLGRGEPGDRVMPVHQGVAGLTLHLYTRREICRSLQSAGFRILTVRPVGLGPAGELRWPGWLTAWRAYGYLVAAERPEEIRDPHR